MVRTSTRTLTVLSPPFPVLSPTLRQQPARSFGPDVVLHEFAGYHWIYERRQIPLLILLPGTLVLTCRTSCPAVGWSRAGIMRRSPLLPLDQVSRTRDRRRERSREHRGKGLEDDEREGAERGAERRRARQTQGWRSWRAPASRVACTTPATALGPRLPSPDRFTQSFTRRSTDSNR